MRIQRFLAIAGVALSMALSACGGNHAGSTSGANSSLHPLPGTSVAAAVDQLPSTGGSIYLGLGIYTSGFDSGRILTKQNVKIYCTAIPQINDQKAPTALTGGTIIQGEFDVAGYSPGGSANGFEMHNCGIDVGQRVVDSVYGGIAHNGLAMSNVGQVVGVRQTTGVIIENVIVLGFENSSPVHAMLFENLTGASFAHLFSYLNGIGQVFKVTDSQIQDFTAPAKLNVSTSRATPMPRRVT